VNGNEMCIPRSRTATNVAVVVLVYTVSMLWRKTWQNGSSVFALLWLPKSTRSSFLNQKWHVHYTHSLMYKEFYQIIHSKRLLFKSTVCKVGTCEASRFDSNSNRPSDSIRKGLAHSKIFESNRPCLLFCSS